MSLIDPSQDYYHINRCAAWSPYELLREGAQIDIGGNSNPYFKFFEERKKTVPVDTNEGQLAVPGVKFIGAVERGEIQSDNVSGIAHELLTHFVTYVRELIWEDVRAKEFPHLPSRQRCIWLIPTLDGVRYWRSRLGPENSSDQVVKVRGQGRVHVASEEYLLGDSEPMEESIKKARLYWLGVAQDEGAKEVIFEGRLKVIEVVDPVLYS